MSAGSGPPLIGITSYAPEVVSWGVWRVPAALVPMVYVDSVERAGGRALIVPPTDIAVEETLDALDALVLSGGEDLDPAQYGAESHPETKGTHEGRDRAELALLRAALDRDMPVLAICRGSQVLNVARGGDLDQHLPERVGHERHREVPGTFSEHEVEVEEGTRLASILGPRVELVHSHHHQGYRRIGNGLRVAAHAPDGTPEALEDPEKRFAVGVLWHPEELDEKRLFESLVAAAREYRASRLEP